MANFDPKKYLEEKQAEQFDPKAYLASKQAPAPVLPTEQQIEEPSMLESAVRGAAQGASFGFADELTGAAEALQKAYEANSLDSVGQDYEKSRDESREAYRAAEEANPITSFAGNLAGGMLIPVPGANAALKGAEGAAKFAKLAGIGAGAGALTGLGMSEKADAVGQVTDALTGAAGGAVVTPALGMGVPAVAKKLSTWWKGNRFGKDTMSAFNLSRENPDFMTAKNAKQVADDLYNTVEGKVLPMVTDDLQAAASKTYQEGIEQAGGATTADDLNRMVDEAFAVDNPAILADPTYQDQVAKTKGVVSGLSGEVEVALPQKAMSTADEEARLSEKLKDTYAKENTKIRTDIENQTRAETKRLIEDAGKTDAVTAAQKAANEWFATEEQKALADAYNKAVSKADGEVNATLNEILGAMKANKASAEEIEATRKRLMPQLLKSRDGLAKKYHQDYLDYYTKAKAETPLTKISTEPNQVGEQVLKAEFIDPTGRKRVKSYNLNKLTNAVKGKDQAAIAEVSQQIKAEKLQALESAGTPSIAKEIDPATGRDMMVLRYFRPDGTEVVKPEIIKAAMSSDTARIAMKSDMKAEDVLKLKRQAQNMMDMFETTQSKQGNPDLYQAASRLNKAADTKLKNLGVDLDTINAKYKTVSEVAGQTGVDLRDGSIGKDPLRRRQAAETLAKDFSTQHKNIGTNQERRLVKTQQILDESGLIDPKKVEQVFSETSDLAYKDYLLRSAFNESYLATDATKYGLGMGAFNARGKLIQGSALAGAATGAAERGVAKVGKTIQNLTPEGLINLAGKVKDTKVAQMLKNIATQPEGKRKALIFSMMQTHAYREALNGLIGGDNE